jgi:hypothetical protein
MAATTTWQSTPWLRWAPQGERGGPPPQLWPPLRAAHGHTNDKGHYHGGLRGACPRCGGETVEHQEQEQAPTGDGGDAGSVAGAAGAAPVERLDAARERRAARQPIGSAPGSAAGSAVVSGGGFAAGPREIMKYGFVEETSLDKFAADEAWWFEQKLDGTRALAVIRTGQPVLFTQGANQPLAHAAAVLHLRKIGAALQRILGDTPGEIVLDGEIMFDTGEYHLFDCLYARFGGAEIISPADPHERRRTLLDAPDLADILRGTPVKVVRQARTERAKRELHAAVKASGGEGLVMKRRTGVYAPGKRVSTVLKMKFVKTADVVVTAVDRPDARHGNFTLGVVGRLGTVVKIGRCSAIGKPASVKVGDVIEVAYLYRAPTGGLVQPRMVRLRPDRTVESCDESQFADYSKGVV